MVTIDRSSTPVPASEIRQLVHGDIGSMYEAHKGALEVISGRGEEPDHLVPARVMERAIEHEARSLQYLGDRPWWVARQKAPGIICRRPPDSARITDDQATAARVDLWPVGYATITRGRALTHSSVMFRPRYEATTVAMVSFGMWE